MNEHKTEQTEEKKEQATTQEIYLKKSEDSFFDKNKTIKIIILLAIIIFACSYVRLYEASMPALDKAAELDMKYAVIEKVKQKMYNPLADPVELQNDMQEAAKNIYREKAFKDAVKKRAETYKSRYYDGAGNPYLVKGDAYFFLDQARLLNEKIYVGQTFFPKLIYYSNKLLPLNIIQTAYYLPLIFAIFSCIVIFFLTAKLTSYWGGFFAGFILAVHPVLLDATSLGYADTQILNVFFSVIISFLFLILIDSNKRSIQLICAALLATFIYLFKITWSTYYYIILVIIAAIAGYFLLRQIQSKSKKKWIFISAEIFLFFVFGYFLLQTKTIMTLLQKLNLETTLYYPNALTYVQELRSLTISEFVKKTDWLIFLIAILSLLYLFYLLWKKPSVSYTFLMLWFAGMAAMSMLAARILYFFISPLAIISGFGLSKIFPSLIKFPKIIHLKIPKKILEPMFAIIVILIISFAVHAEFCQYPPDKEGNVGMFYSMAHRIMDDSIEHISKTIMTKTKEEALVNAWWDLGYIYQYYTRRQVIADGGRINHPNVYWFAKALNSANEAESVDILHMIDCGAARDKLIKADCSVPDSVLIISDYEIMRHPVIIKTSEWDFKLASVYDETKDLKPSDAIAKIKETYPEENAEEIYGHMTQYSNEEPEPKIIISTNECTKKENSIFCGSLTLDLNKSRLVAGVNEEYSFIYVTDDKITRKDTGSEKTIIIYYEEKRIRYASVDSDFADSLLVQLYFLEARNLEHFELLDKASYPYAKKIKAFWIRWEALNKAGNTTQ